MGLALRLSCRPALSMYAMLVLGEYVDEITGQPRDSILFVCPNPKVDIEVSDDTLFVTARDASTIEYNQLND